MLGVGAGREQVWRFEEKKKTPYSSLGEQESGMIREREQNCWTALEFSGHECRIRPGQRESGAGRA